MAVVKKGTCGKGSPSNPYPCDRCSVKVCLIRKGK